MLKPIKTAENQLLKLIQALKVKEKSMTTKELISVLECTKSIYSNEKLLEAVIHSIKVLINTDLKRKNLLSEREKQVILLIGKGFQNTEIAIDLKLSKSTIETHRKNIRKKLKLKGNDSLFAFALIFQVQYQQHNKL